MIIYLFLLTTATGFLIGHFKMRYGGWLPYLAIEGLMLLLVGVAMASAVRNRDTFRRVHVTPIFAMLCVYGLTAIVRPDVTVFSGLMGYRALVVCPALLYAGFIAFQHERHLGLVYGTLAVFGVITALIGIYQWDVGPEVVAGWGGRYGEFAKRMQWTRSQDQFVFRAFSTFVQPGVFGAAMACVLLTVLARVISAHTAIAARVLSLAALPVMFVGMLVSASRLSIVILATGTLVMVTLKSGAGGRVRTYLKTGALLAVTLWFAVSFTGPVLIERLQSVGTPQAFFWRWFNPTAAGLTRSLQNPIGVGLGYTSGLPFFVADNWLPDIDQTGRNVDSGVGAIAVELGIPGVLLYVTFTVLVAVTAVRSWRRLPPGGVKDLLLAPVALAVVAVPLMPIANMMQPSIPVAIMYWFLIGMLFKAPYLVRRVPQRQGQPLADSRWRSGSPLEREQPLALHHAARTRRGPARLA